MSTSAMQTQEVTHVAPKQGLQRGFTLRSFVACVFAMLLLGIWVEYAEVYNMTNTMGGPIGENSPPNGAVGVILILLVISALLYRLRRSLRLTTPELVVIYAALIVAAPLMSGGLWHRLFSVTTTITHYQDYRAYEALPSMLWPHGDNLVKNGRFRKGMEGFTFSGQGQRTWESIKWRGKDWRCPKITNPNDPAAQSMLSFSIPRWQGSAGKRREVLVPGEMYLITLLLKTADFRNTSAYFITMQADDKPPRNITLSSMTTGPTFTLQNGFHRRGFNPVTIPRNLRDRLTFSVGLIGPGSLSVHDIEVMNIQAVEGLYQGRGMVRERNAGTLADGERYFTVVKPDNMFSLAGLNYLVHGFIPLRQWARPALAWTLLIGLLFLGFLCFNVLMRKHWAENEHMPFSMNIFPRELFAGEQSEHGEPVLSIFRNKAMWLGFWVVMPILLIKGLHFYYPEIPIRDWSEIWITPKLSEFFTGNRYLVSLTERTFVNLPLSLLAITLLIEKDILFSIWFTYAVFQLWFLFGQIFSLNRFSGYPWDDQQSIGGFMALALLAVIAARQHLQQVWLHLLGRMKMDDQGELFPYRTAALLLLFSFGGLIAWGIWTRMGVLAAISWGGFLLMLGFVSSRIRAECGLPYGYWMPSYGLMFLMAAGGFPIFGTTAILVATMCSVMLIQAFFYPIAPIQIEMMELARHFRIRQRDIGYGLTLGLLGGLFIGGFALLCWGYGFGICMGTDNREQGMVWNSPYQWDWYHKNHFVPRLANMDRIFADGRMFEPETAPFDVIHNTDAKGVGIGFAVTCLLAVLRNLFTWFPINPIGYVLANTFFAKTNFFTIFVAWAIRAIVLRIGGVHVVRKGLVPFAVGMFIACVVSVIFFDLVGLILRTQGVTTVYSRWP